MLTKPTATDHPVPGSPPAHSPLGAGGWAISAIIISYAAGALLYLPLARLLDPSDFGLYAIATLVSSALTLMIELSLLRALVRMPGDLPVQAQATFWLSVIVGLSGALACSLAGFPLALIYGNSQLVPVLAWLATGVLATALGVVPHALLARELDFRRKLWPETAGVGAGAALALAGGWAGAGVYSLVIYFVAKAVINCLVAWLVVRWWPGRRRPNRTAMGAILAFGLPAGGGELALYARFNVDTALAGLRLGGDALGVYSLAWNTAERPALLLNALFGQVGYATFARLQYARPRLTSIYLSATRLLACAALPVFLGAAMIRQELVTVVFGTKWQAMVEPLLPLLALQALWVIFYPSVSLVLALGHSRVYALVNCASLLLTIAALLAGLAYGLNGVAWAMLVAVGLTSLVWCGLALAYLRPGRLAITGLAGLPLIFTAVTLLAVYASLLLTTSFGLNPFWRLAGSSAAALLAFLVVAGLAWPWLRQDIVHLKEKL